jgi:hypothetical protein
VSFWLALCRSSAPSAQDWQTTRDFYQQAIALSESATGERPDEIDFDAADAHAQLAYTDFMLEWFNAQGANLSDEGSAELFADAANHLDKSLTLLWPHQSDPRSAQFARGLAVRSVYAFCISGQAELAHKHLDAYTSLADGWAREEVVASLDAQLRKECGL